MDDHDPETTPTNQSRERTRAHLLDWLQTNDATSAASSELHRRGLHAAYDPAELINTVYFTLARASLAEAVDNPNGYARRALSHAALDLLRSEQVRTKHLVPRRRDDPAEATDDTYAQIEDAHALDPGEAAITGDHADGVRLALRRLLATTATWMVSAALTTLTLRVHPEVAIPDGAPTPANAGPGQADRWAALWLAGQIDLFPTERVLDTDAQRKARSRHLGKVDELLRRAADLAEGGRTGG